MSNGCNYCTQGCSADCSFCGNKVCLDCAFVYGVPGLDAQSPPTWFSVCVGCSKKKMEQVVEMPEVRT